MTKPIYYTDEYNHDGFSCAVYRRDGNDSLPDTMVAAFFNAFDADAYAGWRNREPAIMQMARDGIVSRETMRQRFTVTIEVSDG